MCAMSFPRAPTARQPGRHGRVINLGDDRPVRIADLAELVRSTLGSSSPIVKVPYQQAFGKNFDDLRDRRPDLTARAGGNGFQAKISLEQTIRDLAVEMGNYNANDESAIRSHVTNAESSIVNRQSSISGGTVDGAAGPISAGHRADHRRRSTAARPSIRSNGYAHIFAIAFGVTLLATPLATRLAQSIGVVDNPDFNRKAHVPSIPYLGGLAVFAGVLTAIAASPSRRTTSRLDSRLVPMAVVIGMRRSPSPAWPTTSGAGSAAETRRPTRRRRRARNRKSVSTSPRNAACDLLDSTFAFDIPTPMGGVHIDVVYWVCMALIAIFVLCGCNAANLIDGLDGLLSGVYCHLLGSAAADQPLSSAPDSRRLSPRPMTACSPDRASCWCLAAGADLGFLPYNWKPAVRSLGDCGSLLLGYLTGGDHSHARRARPDASGLRRPIVFGVPIIDTTLAIIRRKSSLASRCRPPTTSTCTPVQACPRRSPPRGCRDVRSRARCSCGWVWAWPTCDFHLNARCAI